MKYIKLVQNKTEIENDKLLFESDYTPSLMFAEQDGIVEVTKPYSWISINCQNLYYPNMLTTKTYGNIQYGDNTEIKDLDALSTLLDNGTMSRNEKLYFHLDPSVRQNIDFNREQSANTHTIIDLRNVDWTNVNSLKFGTNDNENVDLTIHIKGNVNIDFSNLWGVNNVGWGSSDGRNVKIEVYLYDSPKYNYAPFVNACECMKKTEDGYSFNIYYRTSQK